MRIDFHRAAFDRLTLRIDRHAASFDVPGAAVDEPRAPIDVHALRIDAHAVDVDAHDGFRATVARSSEKSRCTTTFFRRCAQPPPKSRPDRDDHKGRPGCSGLEEAMSDER